MPSGVFKQEACNPITAYTNALPAARCLMMSQWQGVRPAENVAAGTVGSHNQLGPCCMKALGLSDSDLC